MKRIKVISLAIVISMALSGCMAGFELALGVMSAVGDGVASAESPPRPTIHTTCQNWTGITTECTTY